MGAVWWGERVCSVCECVVFGVCECDPRTLTLCPLCKPYSNLLPCCPPPQIQNPRSIETVVEVTEGMEIDRGYISPQFVNNAERLLVEYDGCRVLVTDQKVGGQGVVFRPLPCCKSIACLASCPSWSRPPPSLPSLSQPPTL